MGNGCLLPERFPLCGLGLSLLVKVFRVSKKKKRKKKPYFAKKNFNLNLLSLKNKCVIIN